jgi:hypothetical protein
LVTFTPLYLSLFLLRPHARCSNHGNAARQSGSAPSPGVNFGHEMLHKQAATLLVTWSRKMKLKVMSFCPGKTAHAQLCPVLLDHLPGVGRMMLEFRRQLGPTYSGRWPTVKTWAGGHLKHAPAPASSWSLRGYGRASA